jgi:hypothetical protein
MIAAVEMVLGVAIVSGRDSRLALYLALLLFAVFAAVLALLLHRGFVGSCQCFGSDSEQITRLSVLRAAVLAMAAGLALLVSRNCAGSDTALWAMPLIDIAIGVMALAALWLSGGILKMPRHWELQLEPAMKERKP